MQSGKEKEKYVNQWVNQLWSILRSEGTTSRFIASVANLLAEQQLTGEKEKKVSSEKID